MAPYLWPSLFPYLAFRPIQKQNNQSNYRKSGWIKPSL